jgi:hypothetical protein
MVMIIGGMAERVATEPREMEAVGGRDIYRVRMAVVENW